MGWWTGGLAYEDDEFGRVGDAACAERDDAVCAFCSGFCCDAIFVSSVAPIRTYVSAQRNSLCAGLKAKEQTQVAGARLRDGPSA